MGSDMLVVGSGPAGIACTLALLEQGHSVALVDAGLALEPEIQKQVDELARHAPSEWPVGAADFMTSSTQATLAGVKLKTVFGSDFAYRSTDQALQLAQTNAAIRPSFARGGLSNVWGASLLPLQGKDLAGWPIGLSDLEPHYRALLKDIPFAAVHDDLEASFPLYADTARPLRTSRQARSFLFDLAKSRYALNSNGVAFGQSRLAVQAQDEGDNHSACVYCGLCLSGCPYGAIYNSAQTLDYLRTDRRFRYIPRWMAKRVSEPAGQPMLHGTNQETRQDQTLTAERIFLAGGVLSTTQILLESLQAYDHPLRMGTNQHFMFPWLRYNGEQGVTEEPLHTLSQIFLEIDDTAISQHTIHLQLYTYNGLMRQALRRIGIGYLLELNAWTRDALFGRLLITQGYLHSDDSSTIDVSLQKSSAARGPILILNGIAAAMAKSKIQLLLRKLSGLKKHFRAIPLSPFLSLSLPGGGFHAGGTFPMRSSPKSFESDRWGRPYGFERVHAVDATVFPAIPATAITLNVMANAHRIGYYRG